MVAGRRIVTVVVVGVVALLLSGCLEGADDVPKGGLGTGAGLLVDVRAASHAEEDGFDRVVFEFAGELPNWDVGYVPKPLFAEPSGLPVPLAGTEALQVRMTPATGFDPGGGGYHGPYRFSPGTPEATEVVQLQDFEGTTTWVIGTVHRVPFRVRTLTGPARLVVDLAHG